MPAFYTRDARYRDIYACLDGESRRVSPLLDKLTIIPRSGKGAGFLFVTKSLSTPLNLGATKIENVYTSSVKKLALKRIHY